MCESYEELDLIFDHILFRAEDYDLVVADSAVAWFLTRRLLQLKVTTLTTD